MATEMAILTLVNTIISGLKEGIDTEKNRKFKQIESISDPKIRDAMILSIMEDERLKPQRDALQKIQDVAKHLQWLAQQASQAGTHYGLPHEECHDMASALRFLATELTGAKNLESISIIYRSITMFVDQMSRRLNKEFNTHGINDIRNNVLNKLNDVIAVRTNFVF